MALVSVLVVEDYEPFRRLIRSTLGNRPGLRLVDEASDGLEAVQKAEELQPNLILLDIGLPTFNGIEAARRIRKISPESKIIFVSQESSANVAQEAFRLGAMGYVVKGRAGSELLAAVEAVLQGKQFVSAGLQGNAHATSAAQGPGPRDEKALAALMPKQGETSYSHEVQFYSDDASFMADLVGFVERALEAGDMTVVVATASHRKSLLVGLQTRGIDTDAAMEQEHFVLLDAAEVLSTFMEEAGPNRELFLSTIAPLLRRAEVKRRGVALFGEMVALLCAEGRIKAAIELERMGKELALTHAIRIRCAYPMTEELKGEPYAAICAEHTAVLSAKR